MLQIIHEIESQAATSQEQMVAVRAQIAAKQRDMRLLQLTADELGQLRADANVYEGVGKMWAFFSLFLSLSLDLSLTYFSLRRFLFSSYPPLVQ